MEPMIPDGSYCLFAAPVEGSRQGKTVLVQLRDAVDPETGERYTVKRYESEKVQIEGSWHHTMVMCSGVVLNNNYRPLDPEEFRGFALSDSLAPLVFINGADTRAAQMFTLAHEIAHIWLGQSAVSDTQASLVPDHQVERRCNNVAAELLVPLEILKQEYDDGLSLKAELDRLARLFKVSTLVILRRIHDAGGLTKEEFWREYEKELRRLLAISKGSGGNFYVTQAVRVSKRFARALVISTLEGQTLHRDALRMLGFTKFDTFQKLGRSLGVMA